MQRHVHFGARLIALALWVMIGVGVLPAPSIAAESTGARADTALTAGKYGHGLLWRIDGPKGASSYLFGTIHSDDARVLALPATVRDVFARCRSLTTEMPLDADAMGTMARAMVYTDGRTLRDVLGPALYLETRDALMEYGLPEEAITQQKPWVAVMLLSLPHPGGMFLDFALQIEAVNQKKSLHGLETAAEQVAVFNDLALDDQIVLLKHVLSTRAEAETEFEELTEAWLARDLARLMRAMDQNNPSGRTSDILNERLFTQRDRRMAERMQPRLAEGDAFIAVGAGHLPGVLARLEARGFRVHPLY